MHIDFKPQQQAKVSPKKLGEQNTDKRKDNSPAESKSPIFNGKIEREDFHFDDQQAYCKGK